MGLFASPSTKASRSCIFTSLFSYIVSFIYLLIIYGLFNDLVSGSGEILNTFTVIKAACVCMLSLNADIMEQPKSYFFQGSLSFMKVENHLRKQLPMYTVFISAIE